MPLKIGSQITAVVPYCSTRGGIARPRSSHQRQMLTTASGVTVDLQCRIQDFFNIPVCPRPVLVASLPGREQRLAGEVEQARHFAEVGACPTIVERRTDMNVAVVDVIGVGPALIDDIGSRLQPRTLVKVSTRSSMKAATAVHACAGHAPGPFGGTSPIRRRVSRRTLCSRCRGAPADEMLSVQALGACLKFSHGDQR